MGLNFIQIKQDYLDALSIGSDTVQDTDNPADPALIRDQQAEALANIFIKHYTSGTIIVPAGIAVATAGSAAAQTGATTAPSAPATIS